MQLLFADFQMPCKCNTSHYVGNLRANGYDGTIDVGFSCPKCHVELWWPFKTVDVLFAAATNLRTDLTKSGLSWPPRSEKP